MKQPEVGCLCLFSFFFFLMIRRPPSSTLFPYTPLFRFGARADRGRSGRRARPGPAVRRGDHRPPRRARSEEHTSELQSHLNLVCRLLLEKKKGPPMSSSSLEPSSMVTSSCHQVPTPALK